MSEREALDAERARNWHETALELRRQLEDARRSIDRLERERDRLRGLLREALDDERQEGYRIAPDLKSAILAALKEGEGDD